MKLKDALDNYYTYSGKASDVTRQLAFGAIAVVWIFKTERDGALRLPAALLWPAVCTVLALFFDSLQYLYATAAWGIFHRAQEQKLKRDPAKEFAAPRQINWPTLVCFWLKVPLVGAAYVFLVVFLFRQLF